MPFYQIAFILTVLLLAVLSFIQVALRNQVHRANYGNQEISPYDMRFVNSLLGERRIWNLHKRAYPQSALRQLCVVVWILFLLALLVGISGFLFFRCSS